MLHGHWGGSSIAAGEAELRHRATAAPLLYLVLGPPTPRGIEESRKGHDHIPFLQLGEAAEKMGASLRSAQSNVEDVGKTWHS